MTAPAPTATATPGPAPASAPASANTDGRNNSASWWARTPTLTTVVGAVVAVAGMLVLLHPINDNSSFTHLATGHFILDEGAVPSGDPYSFTAPDQRWVVQSWLVSVVVALIDRAAGAGGLVLLAGLTGMVLASLLWAISRPAASVLARLLLVTPALVLGGDYWAERPLLVGLMGLATVLLAAEKRLDPRWLVPVLWIWANSHGSFPLAFVALGLLALGARLDGERPRAELAALKWAGIGAALAVVSPLGPRVLLFPFQLLAHRDSLDNVAEWEAPTFDTPSQLCFILQIGLLLVACTRRPSWRRVLPSIVFIGMALVAARNLPVASMVLVHATAGGLAGLFELRGDERRPAFRLAVIGMLGVAAISLLGGATGDGYNVRAYPVEAVSWAEENGYVTPDGRLVAPDYAGNYLELRYRGDVKVFIDDRYDMYPMEVVADATVLLRGRDGWSEVLDKWGATAIIWPVERPLTELLALSPGWEIPYRDDNWIVAVPAGA